MLLYYMVWCDHFFWLVDLNSAYISTYAYLLSGQQGAKINIYAKLLIVLFDIRILNRQKTMERKLGVFLTKKDQGMMMNVSEIRQEKRKLEKGVTKSHLMIPALIKGTWIMIMFLIIHWEIEIQSTIMKFQRILSKIKPLDR